MKYRKRPVVIEAVKWNGYNLDEIKKFTGNHADVKYDEKDGEIIADLFIVLMMSLDGEIVGEYPSACEAARVNKIPVQNISSCCLGRLNKCGGYKWRYV